jgi:hypothetical protein
VVQAVRAFWSEGEVQVAIRELSDADYLRLGMAGKAFSKGCRLESGELLNEAVAKLLEGARKMPRTEKLVPVLIGAMKSIASNDRKLHDNALVDSSDEEVVDETRPPEPTPEDIVLKQDLRKYVMSLFEGDEMAQIICEGHFFEQMTEKDLCNLTGLDETKLASKKRAIWRELKRSDVGAHLK